jgi:DNA (cytosine-5)-methyltransferase 1
VSSTSINNLVLFSGCGGVSQALKDIGRSSLGVEIWNDASNTARANGHETLNIDANLLSPKDLSLGLDLFVQASPPCQGLSTAGKMSGRSDIETLIANLNGDNLAYNDERSHLMLDYLKYVDHAKYIMLEQVPAALPVWEAMVPILEDKGFHVWTGVLRTEQFGIAQTRRRAFLLASKKYFEAPQPTHSRFYGFTPDKIDGTKWISVNEALEIETQYLGFPRRADHQASIEIDGIAYRARDLRSTKYPAFALTEKARSWSMDGNKLDIQQAGTLQGFPSYTYTGTRTSQFLQVGNALSPILASVLINTLLSY